MVVDQWFMQIEKVLKAMEITSDATRIRLAAFQLEGEAQVWWRRARTSRDLEAMTWATEVLVEQSSSSKLSYRGSVG